jgi:hypothetical protein
MALDLPRIHQAYARVLDNCVPWVATTRDSAAASLDADALGFSDVARFDPQRLEHAPFLDLVQRLDERAYAPEGMLMPRWVFYDCTAAPGALVGFAQRAEDVDPRVRALLEVPAGYTGLVPIAAYFVIPMLQPGAWQCVGLVTAERLCAGSVPTGAARLAACFALKSVGATQLWASVQWRAEELTHHARFAPLDVLSAWTPAHTLAATLVFKVDLDDERIESALLSEPPPPAAGGVDPDEKDALITLQRQVEAGHRMQVVGPAVVHPGRTLVPVEAEGRRAGRPMTPNDEAAS